MSELKIVQTVWQALVAPPKATWSLILKMGSCSGQLGRFYCYSDSLAVIRRGKKTPTPRNLVHVTLKGRMTLHFLVMTKSQKSLDLKNKRIITKLFVIRRPHVTGENKQQITKKVNKNDDIITYPWRHQLFCNYFNASTKIQIQVFMKDI